MALYNTGFSLLIGYYLLSSPRLVTPVKVDGGGRESRPIKIASWRMFRLKTYIFCHHTATLPTRRTRYPLMFSSLYLLSTVPLCCDLKPPQGPWAQPTLLAPLHYSAAARSSPCCWRLRHCWPGPEILVARGETKFGGP